MKKTKAKKSKTVIEIEPSPDRCATIGCNEPVVITHLGRQRCQRCWEDEAGADGSDQPPAATTEPAETAPSAGEPPRPKRMSALDAAAAVLQETGQALRSGELILAMAERGLWESPGGKTPAATLYAAMMREANTQGDASRFKRVEHGKFTYNGQ